MKRGKIPYNSLIRSVLRVPFERKEVAHLAKDGVFLGEKCVGSSMNTLVMDGKKKEAFAFYRAFNSALSAGIIPDGVQISLTLPETVTEPETKEIMQILQALCTRHNVRILGGHTAFSNSVTKPVFTLVFSGPMKENTKKAEEGDVILLTKNVGFAGTDILRENQKEILEKRFSTEFLDGGICDEENLSSEKEVKALSEENCIFHDVSEGGIFAALYELSEGHKCGFTVELKKVSIRQETIEICEELNLNPYCLYSTGCMLIVTSEEERALQKLSEANVSAVKIGTILKGKQKIIKKGEEERFLERPEQDSVYLASSIG